MTKKQAQLRILELNITVQNQANTIDILTRSLAALSFEVAKLPGGSDLLHNLDAYSDDFDDDDEFKAQILHLVKKDEPEDDDDDDDDPDNEPFNDGIFDD